jgi:preprotein translocase subunit YajC
MTLVELLPFVAIAAAFWLLIIRPSSVRRKAQAALVASLAPGQRIMTTAGVFGTIVAIEAERVSVEVAPGVVIEMLAQAVAQVVPADPGAQVVPADRGAQQADEPDEVDGTEPEAAAPDEAEEPPANPALTPEVDRG